MKKICFFLLAIFLAGCTSIAKLDPSADYGAYPTNYQDAVKAYLQAVLKDPDSARVRYLSEPFKAYARSAPVQGGKPVAYGYLVVVGVNAKNSYGGYTGEKAMRLLIRNDKVVANIEPNPMYFKETWYQ